MSEEDHGPVRRSEREIFLAALARSDAVDRAVFLAAACGADSCLRASVESLLAHHREDAFLEIPPPGVQGVLEAVASDVSAASLMAATAEQPGDRIGRYKILEKIGEGGWGVVYRAEQEEPVRRQVALKVIKLGMDTKSVVARFEAERQALAMMDHPNIAHVFDAGATDTGRPFFVMELVRGLRITEFCDQQKLSTLRRLDLFKEVCSAIQHAHQKGIIHRDVKPSNILVTIIDGVAVPKVIDFGIAKATNQQRLTDKTLLTAFQQFIGTPAYMSPEQAEISGVDIDTRSDIYSLGVVLYELLTGCTPFDSSELTAAGLDAMRRTICEKEPARPSTRLRAKTTVEQSTIAQCRRTEALKLISSLHGDLDWIVMKCLEKDRGRRYATASDLSMDLQRHLQSEPVVARPPSNLYRLQKAVRRNKLVFVASAAVFVALLIGLVASLWQARQAQANAKAENRERIRAEKAETEAKESEAEARAVLRFLEDKVLAAARPEGQRRGRGWNVTLRDALDFAEPSIATMFTNRPLVEASIREVLGTTYGDLGLYTNAVGQHHRAFELRKLNLGLHHDDTLRSMHDLAVAYQHAGRRPDALTLLEETLQLTKAKLGPDHGDTLSCMNSLANFYHDAGRWGEAVTMHREILKQRRRIFGPDDSQTLSSMNNLATALGDAGHRDEAMALFEETLKLKRAKFGQTHPDTLMSMYNLAKCYRGAGLLEKALRLDEETLDLKKMSLGPDHPDTLSSMNGLAASYRNAGQLPKALALFEDTLDQAIAKLGPDHPQTLTLMHNVAVSCDDLGLSKKALELGESALKLTTSKFGTDHPATLSDMHSLANFYSHNGQRDRAMALHEQTLNLRKTRLGPDHRDTIRSMQSVANLYRSAGRHDQAISMLKDALERAKGTFGPVHPDTLWIMGTLGVSYRAAGQLTEALRMNEQTFEMMKTNLGPAHPDTLNAMNSFANSLRDVGQLDRALSLHEDVVKLRRATLGPEHRDTLLSLRNLAVDYRDARRFADAAASYQELIRQQRKNAPTDSSRLANALLGLGECLVQQEKFSDAVPLLREALDIGEKPPDASEKFDVQNCLGMALLGQRKYAEAEPLLIQVYEGLQQRQSDGKPDATRIKRAIQRVVQLYEEWGKDGQAAVWRDKLATLADAKP